MISDKREAFEKIILAAPGFQPRYQSFLSDWQGEDQPWYMAMGELAYYVVESHEKRETTHVLSLFSVVEAVLESCDSEVENLIWVGLFEDIQNIASHRAFDAGEFRVCLGPKSLFAWDEVNRYMKRVADWASRQRT